jgi:hypothetical protein
VAPSGFLVRTRRKFATDPCSIHGGTKISFAFPDFLVVLHGLHTYTTHARYMHCMFVVCLLVLLLCVCNGLLTVFALESAMLASLLAMSVEGFAARGWWRRE